MGECGCGELSPMAKLPAPDGGWFLIEVYPGCSDCGTDWSLAVSRAMEHDEYLVEDAPPVEFSVHGMWGRKILDTQILEGQFRDDMGGLDLEPDDGYDDPADALSDFITNGGLRRAMHATLNEQDGRGP